MKSQMKKVKHRFLYLLVLLVMFGALVPAVLREQDIMNKTFFAMNTYNTITIYSDVSEHVLESTEQDLKKMEELWSVTDKNSEIYSLNHAEGMPIAVEDMTAELLEFALTMSDQTNGALDITLYPVLTAWGFTTGSKQVPTEEMLASKMQLVGYEKVLLSGNSVTLLPGMEIDLGAVAKGYACDVITENLKSKGVTSGIISLGGNIQAIGRKPDGSEWKVSVQHPENGDSLGMLSVSDVSVVTSGAYERYFTDENGKRYGHILDPATGYPAESGIASVTVVGKESKVCDALATAFFVMGLEKTQNYLKEHREVDVLMMTEEGNLYFTQGLKNKFTLSKQYESIQVNVMKQETEVRQ